MTYIDRAKVDGGLFRVSGVVEAPDGTRYRPQYFGALASARIVFGAVRAGALDRGEGFDLELEGPAGVITRASRPVPDGAGGPGFIVFDTEEVI